MKNQRITIPENTRVIIEDGVIIIEPKEAELEIGEWYKGDPEQFSLVLDEKHHSCGFYKGKWHDKDSSLMMNNGVWQLADMKEVKRLLTREVEKREFESFDSKSGRFIFQDGDLMMAKSEFAYTRVFNGNTGKWAEIVKLIQTSEDVVDLYEGDKYWWVDIEEGENKWNITGPQKIENDGRPFPSSTIIFSTREAAEKYIKENKPVYTNQYGAEFFEGG